MINLPTPEDLKRYRKNIGLTQQELAERASVSQSLIARIEAGTVDPRLSTVRKILHVINEFQQKELKAIDVAITNVITIQESDLVSVASKLMFEKGFSQLPVCDTNGRVVGSIKETTISRNLIHKGTEILLKQVKEIMDKDDALPSLPLSASLRSVEALLIQHGHSAVLLMDEGEIAGIVTKADVIRAYLR
ncbi:MAG: CBS domain-containing protein [Candidatus Helarchaeota archaeon]